MGHVVHSSVIPAPRNQVFHYLSEMKHRSKLMPEDIMLELCSPDIPMTRKAEYEIKYTRYGIHSVFTFEIEDYIENERFVERQQIGFFREWTLQFQLEDHGDDKTLLTNIIDYELKYGIVGTLIDDLFLKKDLKRILSFAHKQVQSHFGQVT